MTKKLSEYEIPVIWRQAFLPFSLAGSFFHSRIYDMGGNIARVENKFRILMKLILVYIKNQHLPSKNMFRSPLIQLNNQI